MSQVGSQLAAASAAGSAASPTTPAGMPPASAAGFSAVSGAAASGKAPSAAGSRAPSAAGAKTPSAVGSQMPSAVGGGGGGVSAVGGGGSQAGGASAAGGAGGGASSAVPSAHASHVSHVSRQTTAAQGVTDTDDADALAAEIGPSASEVGVAAAAPASVVASAAPEPEPVAPAPVAQESAPAAEEEEASEKPAKRAGGARKRKKAARADVGGYADVMGEDVGGGPSGGGDELRYSREPDRSAALAGMQDKVVLPDAVQQNLADKQRRISEARRANRDTGGGYPGPHQAGIPRHLVGHVQPQDYGSTGSEAAYADPYVAFASPERDNTDYRLCAACNTPLAATPYCPMTGRRHAPPAVPSLTPAASSPVLSPYSAGGGSGSVLPAHVPAHRGASFHSTSYPSSPAAAGASPSSPYQQQYPQQYEQRQLRTLPLSPPVPGTGASATMSVCESLPYADEDDLRPMAMEELHVPGGRSVIGEAGIDWHRVKHLADQYARAQDQVRGSAAAVADSRFGATDPDGRLRGVSPPRVSPYSPNVGSMVRGYASPQQQHVPVVGGVGSAYGTPSPRVRRTAL